ncbi:MAG: hypothetical protein GX421_12500 [Caldisericales bacterium]|nr:hypothetical protein [Caldisericales bacterium]
MLLDEDILASDYIGTQDTVQDEALARICTRAQSLVEAYLHRTLEAQQYIDEVHDGCGQSWFYLAHKPLIVVTELTINEISIDITTLKLYPESGKVDVDFNISTGKRNIVITYWAGYVGDVVPPAIAGLYHPELPKVIEEAMYQVAHRLWLKSGLSGQAREGLASRGGEGGTTAFLPNLLDPEMIEALQAYREIRL